MSGLLILIISIFLLGMVVNLIRIGLPDDFCLKQLLFFHCFECWLKYCIQCNETASLCSVKRRMLESISFRDEFDV